MNINQQCRVTAEAMEQILREYTLSPEAFDEIWSETARGFETYGKSNLVWASFIRDHNTDYWHKRVKKLVTTIRRDRKAASIAAGELAPSPRQESAGWAK